MRPSVVRSQGQKSGVRGQGTRAMGSARRKKSASLCVQNWRSRSFAIRKSFSQRDLRPGASPPHPSAQLGGLALQATSRQRSDIRSQGSAVRSQKHALRKASGRAAQNPSQVYGDPDSFTACNFSSMDKRIRESAQLAFAPKTCVSPFRIRSARALPQGGVCICMNELGEW